MIVKCYFYEQSHAQGMGWHLVNKNFVRNVEKAKLSFDVINIT